MLNTQIDWLFVGVIGIIVLLFVGMIAVSSNSNDWEQFKQEHDCKQVSVEKGDIVPIINLNGSTNFIIEPDKIGYKCNDGVIYYK